MVEKEPHFHEYERLQSMDSEYDSQADKLTEPDDTTRDPDSPETTQINVRRLDSEDHPNKPTLEQLRELDEFQGAQREVSEAPPFSSQVEEQTSVEDGADSVLYPVTQTNSKSNS